MSWRDQLREASFRGVGFFVDSAEGDFGRRVAVHEYPLTNKPETEDLGERARGHTLDAYVIGADYFTARDALDDALSRPGPGELVHPYRGTLSVVVTGWRLSETTREGGLARFSISFIEFEILSRPSSAADTARVMVTAADAATEAAAAAGEAGLDFSIDSIRLRLLAPVLDALNKIEGYIGDAASTRDQVQTLIETPRVLVARLDADIRRIRYLADARALFAYALPGRRETGVAQANRDQLTESVRALATLQAVRLAAAQVFPSRDEAFGLRDALLAQLEAVSQSADDLLFPLLLDARAALVDDIRARSIDLARITYFTPGETLPALVIAHQLYGLSNLVDRADELVARNRIAHPGFVVGGVQLEVLSD